MTITMTIELSIRSSLSTGTSTNPRDAIGTTDASSVMVKIVGWSRRCIVPIGWMVTVFSLRKLDGQAHP